MIENAGYVKLASSFGNSAVALPGSGSTITLWSSIGNATAERGLRWKRFIVNMFVSHVSAASGLSFQFSVNGGVTWREYVAFTINATTATVTTPPAYGSDNRIQYTNSASVITTWEMEVLGDMIDRTGP